MSPAIHNAGFDRVGHDGVYLPMPIPPEYEHFKATVATWLDFAPLEKQGLLEAETVPLTVGAALKLMNAAKISALFVVEGGKPVGIVHMHDLLREGVA